MTKRYVIMENTPGYLPEEEDPPEFDLYVDALNHLFNYNNELTLEFIEDEMHSRSLRYDVQPILNGQFKYFDRTKVDDLGRNVEIVDREAD